MRIKLYIIWIFLVTISISEGFAQYTNTWAFGHRAGIDFSNNNASVITTSLSTHEGCAAMCDANGQLLFYTDGTSVWRSNHNYMPNGVQLLHFSINVTNSTSQGAVIVPMPGTSDKYYIFSLG